MRLFAFRGTSPRWRGLASYVADPEETGLLCAYFERLLAELPEQYRDLICRVDLSGESPSAVAIDRGVTANALTVRLHSARRRLGEYWT